MKRYLLTAIVLLPSMAFGDLVIKAPKSGESIVFITNNGTVTKKVQITAAGILQADSIQSLTPGSTPPGMVPIGGMVAVMPTTQATDAWQPPASGAIKDGFMRADGATITAQNVTDGSLLRAGTVLPNMVGSFPKGATTSGTATAASKLVASAIPQITGTVTAQTWSQTGSGSAAGQTLGTTDVALASGSAGGQSALTPATTTRALNSGYAVTAGAHTHTTTPSNLWGGLSSNNYAGGAVSGPQSIATNVSVASSGDHAHSVTGSVDIAHTHTASAVSGTTNIGHTHAASLVTGITGTNGTSTATVGTIVGSQTTVPDPVNVTVVWVIRVK